MYSKYDLGTVNWFAHRFSKFYVYNKVASKPKIPWFAPSGIAQVPMLIWDILLLGRLHKVPGHSVICTNTVDTKYTHQKVGAESVISLYEFHTKNVATSNIRSKVYIHELFQKNSLD